MPGGDDEPERESPAQMGRELLHCELLLLLEAHHTARESKRFHMWHVVNQAQASNNSEQTDPGCEGLECWENRAAIFKTQGYRGAFVLRGFKT
ncbi:hypothetical protein VZT92_019498 [Zoarces viviparus]|uniref:Uncharacterized protein n=1 Tax=Zoarces viviparus TaxID=48416 RepID=A0AAW1EKQ3_ZOAVI